MRMLKRNLPIVLLILLTACGKEAVKTTGAGTETGTQAAEAIREFIAEVSGSALENQTAESGTVKEQTDTESGADQAGTQTAKEVQQAAAAEETASEEAVTETRDYEKEEYERLMSRKIVDIDFPRTAENPYDSGRYPNLPLYASMKVDEIDQYFEGMSDVSARAAQLEKTAQLSWFGNETVSQVLCMDDGTPMVLRTEVQTGNELMDPVMHEVGYQNYQIAYSYTFGIWKQGGKVRPLHAQLLIDGSEYHYYYGNDELLYRVGPDGEQYAPETNDFMNSIWKIGCYYGETLYGSKEYSDLTVYSLDRIKEYESFVVLDAIRDSRTDPEEFIIDRNTVFAKEAGAFFEGRSAGDTPLDWFKKQLKKTRSSEEADNSLLGVYRVRRTGAHIDELVDLYWWD